MSTVKANNFTDASGGNTATINSMTPTADSLQGFRNRIINGDMRIDQRNAGAAVTINSTNNTYTLDRWVASGANTDGVFTVDQVTDVPTGQGFINSTKITVTTADASIGASQIYLFGQFIEGTNTADLMWGSASAKTISLSFWINCSLTGTHSVAIKNSANDRSYVATYTVSSANTWEYKTITILGDTTGTWLTDTGRGVGVRFNLGSGTDYNATANTWTAGNYWGVSGQVQVIGTLNATWYITGVQLEVGSVATPFERRPYGTELALCQRYYIMDTYTVSGGAQRRFISGGLYSTTQWEGVYSFPVEMRAAPTLTTSAVGTFGFAFSGATVSVIAAYTPNTRSSLVYTSNSATGAAGYAGSLSSVATNGVVTFISWSAEL